MSWRPLFLTLLLLTGCGTSIGSVRPVEALKSGLAKPPAELSAPCPDPVKLPDGAMGAAVVAGNWMADRAALADCRDRKAAVQKFYDGRDEGLANK